MLLNSIRKKARTGLGSGCSAAVGRAIVTILDISGSIPDIGNFTSIEKTKIKQKEAGNGPLFKVQTG